MPAVGALRVPGDVAIAEFQRPFGGVPRLPAIPLAVDHQEFVVRSAARPLKPVTQIRLGDRRERAEPGIGEPDASGDVEPPGVMPDRSGRKRGRPFRLWQGWLTILVYWVTTKV